VLILSVWHSSRSVQVLNASGTQQVQPEQNESAGVQHVPGPKVRQPRRRTAHVDEGSCPEPIIQTHVQIEWADQQRVVLSRQLLLFTLSHHYDIRNQVRRTGWGCTASHPIVVMRWWVLVCVCACVHLYIHSYKSIYTPNPPYIYIYMYVYTHIRQVFIREHVIDFDFVINISLSSMNYCMRTWSVHRFGRVAPRSHWTKSTRNMHFELFTLHTWHLTPNTHTRT